MFEKAKQICEDEGVEFSISPKITEERMELFWYGGPVICLEYKGKRCIISAIGDVRFDILDKNGNYQRIYCNAWNTGVPSGDELFDIVKTDEEFESYVAVGLVNWINNNWIEFNIYDEDGKTVLYHETDDDASNLNDVISDIGYYIEKLKNFA